MAMTSPAADNENGPRPRSDAELGAPASALFRALAEPARLALLRHLFTGEHAVRDLTAHLGLAQSTVSAHLACLRDCGLVTVRPSGRASIYAIADPGRLATLLAAADALLAGGDGSGGAPDSCPSLAAAGAP